MKKIAFLSALIMLIAFPVGSALAAEFLPKDEAHSGNVVVSGPEEYKNLYVGGGSVIINTPILGDLFAAGGSVSIADAIEQDVFAAGGNITVSEAVGGDARMAGGNISLTAPVAGDALLAGGTISISENATIGGDIWAAGGVLNLTSAVAGHARLAGGEIFINSTITGPVSIVADEKLVFGPNSNVQGPIKYSGRNEAEIQEGAVVGTIDYSKYAPHVEKSYGAGVGAFIVLKLIAMMIAGLLIVQLFKKGTLKIITTAHASFWANLGIGFLGMIVVPLLSIILLATVIGAYVGILMLAWFGTVMLANGIITIIYLGAFAEKLVRKQKEFTLSWRMVIWGALIGAILSLIPVIGWLVMMVFYLTAFGGILRVTKLKMGEK